MQMNIQIGRGAEALDERDRAGVGSAKFRARPLDQKAGNDAVDHPQERREQLRLSGEQKAQRDRKRQHPLAHRDGRDHAIDQMGGGFRHAPRTAGGAKAAPLA
jgi:hypothetical protein